MQVGDLVRVYDFSHVARERLHQKKSYSGIDAYTVGLVVAATDNDPKYRKVLRCGDVERDVVNVNRLEVIA